MIKVNGNYNNSIQTGLVMAKIYLQDGNGDADSEQTCGHREGRRGWDKLRVAIVSGNFLYDTGSSNPVLSDNLEG